VNEELIWSSVIAWAAQFGGITFIRAHENGLRPSGTYGTINIVSSIEIGRDCEIRTELDPVDFDAKVVSWRSLMLSINVFRSDTLNICEKLKGSLGHPSIQCDYFNAFGISFTRSSNVRRLPSIVKNDWEERSGFDLFVNVVFEHDMVTDSIESVVVEVNKCGVDNINVPDTN